MCNWSISEPALWWHASRCQGVTGGVVSPSDNLASFLQLTPQGHCGPGLS